jgi:hypothetical protein
MKHLQKIAVLFAAVVLTVSAFAAKNSVTVTLNDNAVVNGTNLPAGEYKVVIDRDGDNVQATFVSAGKTIAKTSGRFEQRSSLPSSVSLVTRNKDHAVQQILVPKMKGAIVLDDGSPAAGAH